MVVSINLNKIPLRLAILIASAFLLTRCQTGDDGHHVNTLFKNIAADDSFIDKKYLEQDPLAYITNLPDFSDQAQSFNLSEDQAVKIYAVGEILYNINEQEKKYYLMGDDIKFDFQLHRKSDDSTLSKSYVFGYKDVKKFLKEGIVFSWKPENNNTMYITEIKIPWKNIGAALARDIMHVDVNLQIGDNDDGFIQTSEIALTKQDNSGQLYHPLKLLKEHKKNSDSIALPSYEGTPEIDGTIETEWNQIKPVTLKEVVRGFVKDSLDLSARVRSRWDDSHVYFLIEVLDSRQKHIPPKKVVERDIFVDYGWIENQKGELVWKMNAKECKHAGGAFKNQKVDTTLFLPAGRYTLHFVTDESHSFNNWVAPPPSTPFHGIVIYKTNHGNPDSHLKGE